MRRGMSVSEVVVGLGICAIAVFALVTLQAASLGWKSQGTARQQAGLIANSVLNEKLSLLRENFVQSVAQPRGPATAPYEVEVEEDSEASDLKRVVVTVYWSDERGEQRYRLVTRAYPGG